MERNFGTMLAFIRQRLAEGKIVTLGDNAYANGADLTLLSTLNHANLLAKIHGYAGWNTNANTLGTSLAMAIQAYYANEANLDFLVSRYIEDGGYCAYARGIVSENLPAGNTYFTIVKDEKEILQAIYAQLQTFLSVYLSSIAANTTIKDLYSPWHRMFEIGFTVEYKK